MKCNCRLLLSFPDFFRLFTLIELLMVISIIAVLTAVLLPSLKNARDKTHEIVCRSNLKQIGLIENTYSLDGNLLLPGAAYLGDGYGTSAGSKYWHDRLLFTGYIPGGNPEDSLDINASGRMLYHCPSDRTGWITYSSAKFYLSYGRNSWLGAFGADVAAPRIFLLTQVSNPSKVLLYADNYGRSGNDASGVNGLSFVFRNSRLCLPVNNGNSLNNGVTITSGVHQKGKAINVHYFDGHCGTITSKDRDAFRYNLDEWNN